MLKFTSLIIGTAIAAVSFPQTAWSQLAAPELADPLRVEDSLVCFMRTPDGRTLNLNRICGSNAQPNGDLAASSSASTIRQTPQANLGGLQASAETTGCFGLDAEGRPCPTPP